MAKSKPKKISINDALIPIERYPYSIPDNWCWTYLLMGAAECMDIYRKPVNAEERANREGDIPYYGATGQVGWIDDYLTDEQLVLLGEDGAPFYDLMKDKAYIIEGKAWVNNHAHILRSLYGEFGNKFLMYYLNSFNYHGFVNGSTRLKLTQANMAKIPVPLPPLAEQQRIVEKIESFFSKLDEAREKAQDFYDGYEDRLSAIFHAAFTGKLTEKWRQQNNKEYKWSKARFDEVAEIKSNLVDPKDYQDYPHIAPDNIEKKTGVLLEYKTIGEDGVTSGKHRFYAGQILYSKIRPYLSKVVMVDFDGLCSADMYPIEAKINTNYLFYFMLSDDFLRQASSAGSRLVLPKINQKELSAVMVDITSNEEQEEVVKILDYIIPLTQQARDMAENVIKDIDMMKKTILAKACRGELGTNNLMDESAMSILNSAIESR